MPVRIYALAKELSVDSKELVEVVKKAGITGKGSALASLEDDEVAKVREFLKGPKKAAPKTPAKAEPEPEKAFSRDDYIAPAGKTGKVKVLGAKLSENAGIGTAEAAKPKQKKPRTPVIKLAELPDVPQPTVEPSSSEPAAQKPELRLPKDAIKKQIKGDRAPLEAHVSKTEKKQEAAKARQERKGSGDSPLGKTVDRARRKGKLIDSEGVGDLTTSRADRQKARKTRARQANRITGEDDTGRTFRRRRTLTRRKGTNTAAPRTKTASLTLPCTVRSLSEAAGVSSGKVLFALMQLGVQANINATIEDDMVEVLLDELGVDLEIKPAETLEDSLISRLDEEDAPETLVPRPPVVTFLGHVDHGKTSLLDYIIGIDVVAGEAGGITQHIRAYEVDKDGRKISFVDTPGHEAFTEMRARGANVTDIAVLVVAVDDGIMPQTEEAISHAKAAGVPIIVALNKCDLPGVDPNKAMQGLTQHELVPSEWGGDVEVVKTSALTGEGMDELLDTILTVAEIHEYKANPDRKAVGVCLEAEQEGGRGVIAKLIVQKGTLHVGDVVVCGAAHGRVKAMYDTLKPSVRVEAAGPTVPVNVTGFDVPPEAGDRFYVLDEIADAREIAGSRELKTRETNLSGVTTAVSLEKFQELLAEGKLGRADEVAVLNIILRADVRGSIEAIQKEFGKLHHPEVQVKILQASVGGVTAADVTLAHASSAVIVAFNVIPDEAARSLADQHGVEIRRYDIIYKVTDDIRAMLEGKLKPEERVVELGHAVVKQVFAVSKLGSIAGCYVVQGTVERGCRIRVNRDGRTIGDYALDSLRRVKDDVKEVARGFECGIKLAGFNDVKQDDVLEAYKIEEVARTL